MSNALSILVLCGGQSTEHDISLLSAKNVIKQLDAKQYHVHVAKITHDGEWYYFDNAADYFSEARSHLMHLIPGQKNPFFVEGNAVPIDCVFPVLHGTHGEDGTMQGLLELLQIPYVGADCLGSAITMDKDIAKQLLRDAKIPVVDWKLIRKTDALMAYSDIKKQLGDAVFIKPNSLGSSVGVKKAMNEMSFHAAIQDAFRYDEYVLVEKLIVGREIECSVLGNEKPAASLPGEIINHTEFYSFDAKYVDADSATVKTPADLSPALVLKIQALAVQAFQVLRCLGMARVDFFLTPEEKIYINEVNTIPGFTNISMYPKNWEASGLSHAALLDQLIALAMQRFKFKKSLIRVFQPVQA
ncbi:MAG: D-alanine--D-alanine ligase [Gammaproteobacteria bacterium CG_4_10_14_0_8_um_filter_38_16]|nr:MAG: D-alanine--D-alanine ligase [Gammaproteobacteria bacterium CG_4_10_14_0_8_um_filter_38_16]PJA02658.1 MAG: D-alanine--D-alanine ligase [Gammaproteobacteria bacterium CG_4_10_14_0_2_um_filter_38_22]PJB09874.1 MAG: D-alanine--D-alanine ligase [Gammaproteobacteria bacterium CG_4_9_14_3_um_filter_38_9]